VDTRGAKTRVDEDLGSGDSCRATRGYAAAAAGTATFEVTSVVGRGIGADGEVWGWVLFLSGAVEHIAFSEGLRFAGRVSP